MCISVKSAFIGKNICFVCKIFAYLCGVDTKHKLQRP